MSDAVERAYLNIPSSHMEKVSQTHRLRESHDQESPFERLRRKEAREEHKQQQEQQDTYESPSSDEETDKEEQDQVVIVKQKQLPPADADAPGFIIDVTV